METATIATVTGIGMGTGIATAIVTGTAIVTATAATATVAGRETVGKEKGRAEKGRAEKGQAHTEEARTASLFQIHQNGKRAGGTVREKPAGDLERAALRSASLHSTVHLSAVPQMSTYKGH